MAQPVDLLVDRRVLLDVEVPARNVRLGLVVVVIRDEVLDRVVREERPEFVAELGGERLVVGHDERRLLQLGNRGGHRHRLAGAGGPEQRRVRVPGPDRGGDLLDRLRLVGGGAVGRVEAELGHGLHDRRHRGQDLSATLGVKEPR